MEFSSQFPQLGGEGERYRVKDKEGVPKVNARGNPQSAMRYGSPVNLGDATVKQAAIRNFVHSIETAHPDALRSGRNWYPAVHDAVAKGIRGNFLSAQPDRHLAGSALVAAVSPNMDWERNNIGAFDELKGLDSEQWGAIARGGKHARAAVEGLSIAAAGTKNLQKAHRIVMGEDPNSVLDERSAPKTHNFMHNIHNPENPAYATVDGRAFDTMTNRVRGWEVGRGIQTAQGARGVPTRYEHARHVMQVAAAGFGMSPSEAQAVSWEHVKQHVERLGGERKQGPARLGQPYFHPETGQPAVHDLSAYRHLSSKQFNLTQ
jgi:hypothetical protein